MRVPTTMMRSDLIVSPSPHVHSGSSIASIYHNILLALLPATLVGFSVYGVSAIQVVCASVASAMLAEALFQLMLRRPVTVADGSAAVSGLLLGLILPAGTPLYVVVVANFLGIIVGKQFFGGLGANPLNPVLVGWAAVRITKTWAGFLDFDLMLINHDTGFSMAYPLAVLKAKGAAALQDVQLIDLLLGKQSGGIGASAIIWLFLGGFYLLVRGMVPWEIPLGFFVGMILTGGIFWVASPTSYASPVFHILTGNAVIGAFFLLTDTGSSPTNRWAMLLYGFIGGAITIVLRVWSTYPDGVVFAGLLASLFAPLLDKLRKRQEVPPSRPLKFL